MQRTTTTILIAMMAAAGTTAFLPTSSTASAAQPDSPEGVATETVFVADGVARGVRFDGAEWTAAQGCLKCGGTGNCLMAERPIGPGDFCAVARLSIANLGRSAATFMVGGSHFGFEGGSGQMFTEGALLGRKSLGPPVVREGEPFDFEMVREGDVLRFLIDGNEVHRVKTDPNAVLQLGLRPWRSTMRVERFAVRGNLVEAPKPPWEIDVYTRDTEGYHTFRIPAIVTSTKGTLLAFCEGRKGGGGDSGDIDIVLRRSTDSGDTWSDLLVVADHEENTIGNPCPVVDRATGRIWLPLTWNLGSDREGEIMAGTSQDVRRVYLTYSDDDGLTWAPLEEISATTRQDHWRWYATGPCRGIQLERGEHAGRLVIPANHSDHSDPDEHPYRSHVIFSDDHGRTWQLGGVLGGKTNESTIVELSDGRLMDNMRSYHGEHRRAIATSGDGGATWSDVTLDATLVEPVCQASILRYTFGDVDGKSRILFSNPASTGRQMMTVRASYDEGQTWPVAKLVCAGSAAYSCLTVLPDRSIGLLYERDGYRKIAFARFDLQWLTDGKDRLGRRPPESD